MAFADEFWAMVEAADSVCITSHKSPDDDAISSVLAMYWLVTQKYPEKKTEMVYTGQPEEGRYESFRGWDRIKFVDDLAEHLSDYDLLILTDGNERGRFSGRPDGLKNFSGKTVCIDHHGSPPEKFDLACIDAKAPACAAVIYELFVDSEVTDLELARIFLLGILGDSGNFSYLRPDQMGVLETGRKLLSRVGKSLQDFTGEYATITERMFETVKKLMNNTEYRADLGDWPPVQLAYLDRNSAEEAGLTDAEISQAAHVYMDYFLRLVRGYRWGVLMTPRANGEYNLSLRSLGGSVNVRRVMERMKLGGGHDRAAGGTVEPQNGEKVELATAKSVWENWLKENRPEEGDI